jgi:hypothetical protein
VGPTHGRSTNVEVAGRRRRGVSSLVAVVHVGHVPPLGGGMRPTVVAHWYEGGVSRLLAYEVDEAGALDRVPGAYAPDLDEDPAYPVTDLLLALAREYSSVAQRLDTLDTKAEANYGASFREKVFDSQVAWGSDAYGRHFEARSQLESHLYEGRVVVGVDPDAPPAVEQSLAANLDRIDGPTAAYERPTPD